MKKEKKPTDKVGHSESAVGQEGPAELEVFFKDLKLLRAAFETLDSVIKNAMPQASISFSNISITDRLLKVITSTKALDRDDLFTLKAYWGMDKVNDLIKSIELQKILVSHLEVLREVEWVRFP